MKYPCNNFAPTVMIHWLPEMMCIDPLVAFGNREGAVFNNALVRRKRTPEKLILDKGIPRDQSFRAGNQVDSDGAVLHLFINIGRV